MILRDLFPVGLVGSHGNYQSNTPRSAVDAKETESFEILQNILCVLKVWTEKN